MNTRLKILTILFSIAYGILVFDTVVSTFMPAFIAGIEDGWNDAKEDHKNKDKERGSSEIIHCYVQPHEGIYSFPTPVINMKTGLRVFMETNTIKVKIEDAPQLSLGLIIVKVIEFFVSLALLFFLIFIPIQAYKIIRSIHKNIIFDEQNIRRIRRIGYALLIMFGLSLFVATVSTMTARELLSLEDYKIIFTMQDDYGSLMFGLVVLLFAEVLKIATSIKEEQDLTV